MLKCTKKLKNIYFYDLSYEIYYFFFKAINFT